MGFQKADKEQSLLRGAFFGPSGAGKTWTALAVGTGIAGALGGRLAVLDSERKTSAKYANFFDFDIDELVEKSIDECTIKINEAAKAGYKVLMIDSLTHPWQQLQDEMEKLSKAQFKGNYWAAWSKGTPKQRRFINALNNFPGHLIVTMRSRTEWETDPDTKKPVRVGLAPEQGKGIEYEFDFLLELTPDHIGTVIKDRTHKFQDAVIEKPGRDFGVELVNWLMEGTLPKQKTTADVVAAFTPVMKQLMKNAGYDSLDKAVDAFNSVEGDMDALRQLCEEKVRKASAKAKRPDEPAAKAAAANIAATASQTKAPATMATETASVVDPAEMCACGHPAAEHGDLTGCCTAQDGKCSCDAFVYPEAAPASPDPEEDPFQKEWRAKVAACTTHKELLSTAHYDALPPELKTEENRKLFWRRYHEIKKGLAAAQH